MDVTRQQVRLVQVLLPLPAAIRPQLLPWEGFGRVLGYLEK